MNHRRPQREGLEGVPPAKPAGAGDRREELAGQLGGAQGGSSGERVGAGHRGVVGGLVRESRAWSPRGQEPCLRSSTRVHLSGQATRGGGGEGLAWDAEGSLSTSGTWRSLRPGNLRTPSAEVLVPRSSGQSSATVSDWLRPGPPLGSLAKRGWNCCYFYVVSWPPRSSGIMKCHLS